MVDGVEQLQTFFGQYLPQVAIAACAPLAIFAFIAFWDVPVAAVMLAAALFTLVLPSVVHERTGRGLARPPAGLQGVRRGIAGRDAGPADTEGVRPERHLRPDAGRQGARAVREHDDGAGHQRPDARHHRSRLARWARRRRWRWAPIACGTAR